ncbi:hypothetical protein D9Q98_010709 [Chlorella vulgaris]|uniref:Major facilitator superfamily (MFS) profile domain-containing protein n=1 Tax=Chlorella vulgaris TaxID=3077 RepID=A0A9D4TEE6_CHLVU|nr:hypothetical protein D9Q98_010709 [Chlorella vulgaris]
MNGGTQRAGAQNGTNGLPGAPPNAAADATKVENINSKRFDVEYLGPDLRSLSARHTQEELDVVARLAPADHDFPTPEPKPTRNPVLMLWRWWVQFLLPGMGMFSEAYFIFAIGNIKPLFAIQYPACFGKETPHDCNQSTMTNIQNLEISAIIAGMLGFGFVADVLGRKWGSRTTMIVMFIGGCLLTGAYGPKAQVFLSVFCFALFFYSCGVGGEYPLAASSASERAEADPKLRKRRGETVVLTFSQQGWGNFANTLVILLLLAIQGATGDVSSKEAEITWRVQFGIGTVICFCVMVYRWLYLTESKVWRAEHESVKQELRKEKDPATLLGHRSWREHYVIFKFYWPRLLITCLGWVANDFAVSSVLMLLCSAATM